MILQDFIDYFAISSESPSGLIWISDYFANSGAQFGFKGKTAGRQYDKGYWRIGFKGRRYEIHRIVYLLANGSIDDSLEIDHIDHNPANNLLENLRLVSKIDNLSNRLSKASTGVTGVYMNKRRNSVCSHWQVNGLTKFSKTYRIDEYGFEEAVRLAAIDRSNGLLLQV